jgi:glycosyl transferase family 4
MRRRASRDMPNAGERRVNVLCLTNMYPTEADPSAGCFVRDLVEDVHALGVDVEVLAFDGRERKQAYAEAGLEFRRALHRGRFDLVHAHYGLTGALAVWQWRVPVVVTFMAATPAARTHPGKPGFRGSSLGWRRLSSLAETRPGASAAPARPSFPQALTSTSSGHGQRPRRV